MDDRVDERPIRALPLLLAAVLTFVAAASVLVLEIAAGRLLAPYVGVTLTTYTGIIGAILAGIALGAWVAATLCWSRVTRRSICHRWRLPSRRWEKVRRRPFWLLLTR